VLPKIRARHRQRRADETAVGLCACESGGSRRGPARLRERRRAREGLEERDARPLGCRLPKDALGLPSLGWILVQPTAGAATVALARAK
jgi:hypothetical protein